MLFRWPWVNPDRQTLITVYILLSKPQKKTSFEECHKTNQIKTVVFITKCIQKREAAHLSCLTSLFSSRENSQNATGGHPTYQHKELQLKNNMTHASVPFRNVTTSKRLQWYLISEGRASHWGLCVDRRSSSAAGAPYGSPLSIYMTVWST